MKHALTGRELVRPPGVADHDWAKCLDAHARINGLPRLGRRVSVSGHDGLVVQRHLGAGTFRLDDGSEWPHSARWSYA